MVVLSAIGDIEFSGTYFGRYEKSALEKLGSKHRRLADQIRQHARDTNSELILEWLEDSKITFANLETTLAKPRQYDHPRPSSFYRLRTDPSDAEDLKSLGIDVVNLANNHLLDLDDFGLIETIKSLDEAGLKHFGAGMNLKEALSPAIVDVEGQKIAFLGFATEFQKAAAPDRPGVAAIRGKIVYEFRDRMLPTHLMPVYTSFPSIRELPLEEDFQMMQGCIKGVRDEADFVVVYMHWGPGIAAPSSDRTGFFVFEAMPTDYQRVLGHALIDTGADLVLGGHTHTAQAIEIYKNKHIFYSLGNFAMQIESDIARSEMFMNEAIILKINIENKKSSEVEILPTRIDVTGLPMITEDYENVIEHLRKTSSSLNASLVSHKKGAIVEPINK